MILPGILEHRDIKTESLLSRSQMQKRLGFCRITGGARKFVMAANLNLRRMKMHTKMSRPDHGPKSFLNY